jgi:Na+/H+-translocating membrane pyrophosphatase
MHKTIEFGRKSWMNSRTANVAFLLGSWSAIVTSIVVIVLALTASPRTFKASELYGGEFTFFFLFTMVALLIVLHWYLWLSMLWFLSRRARLPLPLRLVWFLAVLFGLSLGAALFYLFAWRSANSIEDASNRAQTPT